MKKTTYKNITIKTEEGEEQGLEYSLLETETDMENFSLICYGFEIKKTFLSFGKKLSEIKQVPNIFISKDEAVKLLDKLVSGKVTPISLSAVIEDYIHDEISLKNRLPVLL